MDAEPEFPVIYKFQSCALILRQVLDFYAERAPAGRGKALRTEKMKLIGVYSPIGRAGKTTFALALGKELAKRKRTLYLNLEEYSGFETLYPYADGWTLSELMYFLKQGKNAFACKLESIVQEMGGLHYVPPLKSPVELRHICLEDWERLLEALGRETGYERILLDLSGAVNGIFELLDRCDGIYTPICRDETGRAKLSQYEDTLKLLEMEEILKKTKQFLLPGPGAELEELVRAEGRSWSGS